MKFFTKKQFLTVFIEYPNTGNNLNVCQQLNKPIVVYLYNGLLHNNDSKSAAAPREITIRKINQAQRNISLPKIYVTFVHMCSVVSGSLQPHRLQPSRFLCPWDSPCKNITAGYHFLLQRFFHTQGWNCIWALEGRFFITEPPGKHYIKFKDR